MRGVYFGGLLRRRPGAYSVVDTSTMVAVSTGGQKILAFIGECTKGAPQTALAFNDPVQAKNALGSGDLLKAMMLAWAPSKTMNGADLIYAIRVNKATQAKHTLKDSTPADAIELTAREYGDVPYKVKVGAGTSGKVIVTLTDGTITEVVPEGDNAAIVAWLNANSKLVTAVKKTDTLVAVVADLTAFTTAGTNPAATATDWEDCVDKLANMKVHGIVPVTSDATVHAYLDTAIQLSSKNRRERRGFYGHAAGETVDQILARIKALSTHRAVMPTPGIKSSVSGTLETLTSVFHAAAIAGMWAGNDPAEPLTFDMLNCSGLETVYSDADIDALLAGGAMVAEETTEGYRIIHAQTTHLADDNIALMELSCSTLADDMSIELREHLEKKFVGTKPSPSQSTSVYNATKTKLEEFVRRGWLVADPEKGLPAFRNIQVSKNGTARYVDWEGSISTPDNYLLITSHFTV